MVVGFLVVVLAVVVLAVVDVTVGLLVVVEVIVVAFSVVVVVLCVVVLVEVGTETSPVVASPSPQAHRLKSITIANNAARKGFVFKFSPHF